MKARKFEHVIPVEAVRLTEVNLPDAAAWLRERGMPACISIGTDGRLSLWCSVTPTTSFAARPGQWVVLEGGLASAMRHKYFKRDYRRTVSPV